MRGLAFAPKGYRLALSHYNVCWTAESYRQTIKTDPTTALIDEVLGGLQQKLEEGKTFTGTVKDTLTKLRRRQRAHLRRRQRRAGSA